MFVTLIHLSMNSWLRERSGKNMHYLLIIKIKGGINKPERKGTFVLCKTRFPTFCYPSAVIFFVVSLSIAEHHRLSFLVLELRSGLVRGGGGGGGGGEAYIMLQHVCVSVWDEETSRPQVQEETACFWLVTLICSDKQFLWSPAHRDITGNDWVFAGGLCACVKAQACSVCV